MNDDWFFTTREGVNLGPHKSYEDAEKAVFDYLDFLEAASPQAMKVYLSKINTP